MLECAVSGPDAEERGVLDSSLHLRHLGLSPLAHLALLGGLACIRVPFLDFREELGLDCLARPPLLDDPRHRRRNLRIVACSEHQLQHGGALRPFNLMLELGELGTKKVIEGLMLDTQELSAS